MIARASDEGKTPMHPADALFETREAIRRLRRQEAWLRAQVVAARTDRRGAAWEAVVVERRRRTAGPEDGPRLGAGAFWRERLERRVVLRPVGGADGQAGPAK